MRRATDMMNHGTTGIESHSGRATSAGPATRRETETRMETIETYDTTTTSTPCAPAASRRTYGSEIMTRPADGGAAAGSQAGAAPVPAAQRGKTIISGSHISKRYVMGKDNFVDALQDASLEIEQSEMIGVMGPSGSGKSTLVHILGCLDSVNSGEVWLDGRRVDKLGRRELAQLRRSEIGFIFQTFNLVPSFTALENVMLAAEYAGRNRREARQMARTALAQVGLADRESHKPTELSGGQQQRVAIARALVNGPKVIFGDEPTGNLDSASSQEIVAMMHDINRRTGTTFVLVTHDSGVAATCDRVFHMLDGRVTNGQKAAGQAA
jgi:putative ABC transport system ATP-binding protein